MGQYIVADPEICHGKPTFRGTRIMVWQVLDALARGESAEAIVAAWDGKVSREAIAETVRLAREALRIPAEDGRGVLIAQGAASFERFFGVPAPVSVMRQAVEDALRA